MCARWWGCSCGRSNSKQIRQSLFNQHDYLVFLSVVNHAILQQARIESANMSSPMTAPKLKIFYKGNKLSTLYTSSAHLTVLSANDQNLCETTGLPSQTSLLATDAQESTVNSLSESQTTIAYAPYGNDSSPPASPLLSRFTGQSWLPSAIGYMLGNGHRLFNPGLMRFHSADSFSPFAKGGLNTYIYCGNDPVNRVDPSGRFFGRLFKRLNQGYSYKKLAPRLDESSPSLSNNEYNALLNSVKKRQLRSEKKLDRGLTHNLLHTTKNALQELSTLDGQRAALGSLSADQNGRLNFDTRHLTQELHGEIPVYSGHSRKRAEEILNSPSTIDPSISEELVYEELLERLRRLREG